MAAWMMSSVSLRPIPIDFEWNECGVNVMVRVGLIDIERGREWVRVDGWCQFRRIPSVLRVPPADCGLGYPLHGHEGEARAFELLAGGRGARTTRTGCMKQPCRSLTIGFP